MQSEMPTPGSYEPFRLKEKIGEMMKYGRPLTKNFSRKIVTLRMICGFPC